MKPLRAILEADHAPARTRSSPEERLLSLIREAKLPHPEVNAPLDLGGEQRGHLWEVDFLWREQRLVIEVDAYATHSSPFAFERDRRKTAELLAAGFSRAAGYPAAATRGAGVGGGVD